jgi:hypothetical protein
MWDKDKSPTKYENIRIRTKCGWPGQAKITVGSCLETLISGLEDNGSPLYQTISATTIAQLAENPVLGALSSIDKPGLFGSNQAVPDDRKLKKTDYFYEGVAPNLIQDEEKLPKWTRPALQEFMTFEGSRIIGVWDETTGPKVQDGNYRIIAAQEAPVIITCISKGKFEPFKSKDIVVDPILPSAQGETSKPLDVLLTKVENPMGYGAEDGDLVTVQRVFTNDVSYNVANYKYIVIGTGKPPETGD